MTGKMFSMGAVGATAFYVAVLVGALPGAVTFGQITYQTRALTGDAAPGTGASVVFDTFLSPVLNNTRQTAFRGAITGPGVGGTNNAGIWSGGRGALGLVARKGDAAPGTGAGVVFGNLISPKVNDAGQVMFESGLTGTGVTTANDRGIWSDAGGSLALVAREGDAAPGTDTGVVFDAFFFTGQLFPPVFSGAGESAFYATLTGTGVTSANDSGIWAESGGSLGLVKRASDAAPGTTENFADFTYPVINGSGEVAFQATLTGTSNTVGVWSEGSGSLALVVRKGDTAPGTSGATFGSFGNPVINDADDTAFEAVYNTSKRGIWLKSGSTLSLVARPDTSAAGLSGINYGNLAGLALNGKGQVAFHGYLTGGSVTAADDTALWAGAVGALELIAREGDAAPGTGAGVKFGSFHVPVPPVPGPFLNNEGQTAFQGGLTGTGVTTANDVGIWATDAAGDLQLIAREGDLFDVDDDPSVTDNRTISLINMKSITFSGGEEGRYDPINDACQLTFRLQFTDGSFGVFVAKTAVPADTDADGDVDCDDFEVFVACHNKSGNPPKTVGCTTAQGTALDFDDDNDVDGADCSVFISCYNGAGNPPKTDDGCPCR